MLAGRLRRAGRGLTELTGGLARPSLEGANEGGRLGVADHVGDLRKAQLGRLQIVLGRLLARLVQQRAEALAALSEPPFQRLAADVELVGDGIDVGRALWQPLYDELPNPINKVLCLGASGPDDLLTRLFQDFQELGVGTFNRQTHRLFRIGQNDPLLGPEFDRTAENFGVLCPDLRLRLLVRELHPKGRDRLARQIPATAHQRGDKKAAIVFQTAQGRIGLPDLDRHHGTVALDLELAAFAHDLVEALQVDHGIHQRRRVERDKAQQPALARVPGRTEPQPIAGLRGQVGGALDQFDYRDVGKTRFGIIEFGLAEADLLQQSVDGKTTTPQVVDNKASYGAAHFGGCRHRLRSMRVAEAVEG